MQGIIDRARIATGSYWVPLVAIALEAIALVSLGKLIVRRSGAQRNRERDAVDESSAESFPASDPPALSPGRGS